MVQTVSQSKHYTMRVYGRRRAEALCLLNVGSRRSCWSTSHFSCCM